MPFPSPSETSNPTTSRPSQPQDIRISALTISPLEVWPNNPVNVSAKAFNWGTSAGSLTISLVINGVIQETETVQLPAGTGTDVKFSALSEASQGTYFVQVQTVAGTFMRNTLSGNFSVVRNGYHTLIVAAGPISGNGVAKA